MFKQEQEHYGELGADYWWLGGKYAIVIDLMRRHGASMKTKKGEWRILDAGCGPGNLIDLLKPYGTVDGIDFSPEAMTLAKGKGYNTLQLAGIEQVPFPDNTFDVVVVLDIIEHTPDDKVSIAEAYRVLKPGGQLVFSLPAYMFMWGHHDDQYGHYRRYTKTEIRKKLESAGFVTKQITYIEPLFLLPLFIFRKLKRLTKTEKDDFVPLPSWLNVLLRNMIAFEKYIVRLFSIPFGVSILGVVEKPRQ